MACFLRASTPRLNTETLTRSFAVTRSFLSSALVSRSGPWSSGSLISDTRNMAGALNDGSRERKDAYIRHDEDGGSDRRGAGGPDGGPRRPQPHAFRMPRHIPRPLRRRVRASAPDARSLPAARADRLGQHARRPYLHRVQRPNFPQGHEGLAAAARLARPPQPPERPVPPAPRLARLVGRCAALPYAGGRCRRNA